MLNSEKILLENELKLFDNNNNETRNHIEQMENKIDIETNAKQSEDLTNHGLKQNLIDLQGKHDLLQKEISNLQTTYEKDLKQENAHLNEILDKSKIELFESNKICDDLRAKN